jgi:hypothetical protein
VLTRELLPEERSAAARGGLEVEVYPIARDAVVAVVNAANPVENMTLPDLRSIYRGEIASWRDLGGGNRPIHVVIQPPDADLTAFFVEAVMGGEPVTASSVYARVDSSVVADVSRDPDAVGYVTLAGVGAGCRTLRVATMPGMRYWTPDLEAVHNGDYPLTVSCTPMFARREPRSPTASSPTSPAGTARTSSTKPAWCPPRCRCASSGAPRCRARIGRRLARPHHDPIPEDVRHRDAGARRGRRIVAPYGSRRRPQGRQGGPPGRPARRAQRLFEKAASQGSAEGRSGVGQVWLKRRQYDKAREAFELAQKMDPLLAWPYYGQGEVVRKSGKCDAAIPLYQKATELDRKFRRPRWRWASA